jgi:CheY-like chemotaxis protein
VPESLPSHNITLPSADKPPSKASALSLQLIQSHQKRSTPLRILAVDDESIYTEYLRDIIAGDNDIAAQVEFASAAKVTEALVKAREWRPDIAILDVDFGDPTCDGFGLSQQLRALLPNLRICIHSNRISAKDGAVAVAAGAEAFVPKPMMPAHLVRFLASTVLDMHDGAATTGNDVVGGRPVVAIVDDDIFVAESWEETLGDVVNAYVFSNPAGFRHRFEVDAAFRDRLTVVILDYHFDGVAETGADLARELRKRSRASLLFGSDAEVPASEREAFDAVCGKKARPWAELRAAITPTALLS